MFTIPHLSSHWVRSLDSTNPLQRTRTVSRPHILYSSSTVYNLYNTPQLGNHPRFGPQTRASVWSPGRPEEAARLGTAVTSLSVGCCRLTK